MPPGWPTIRAAPVHCSPSNSKSRFRPRFLMRPLRWLSTSLPSWSSSANLSSSPSDLSTTFSGSRYAKICPSALTSTASEPGVNLYLLIVRPSRSSVTSVATTTPGSDDLTIAVMPTLPEKKNMYGLVVSGSLPAWMYHGRSLGS